VIKLYLSDFTETALRKQEKVLTDYSIQYQCCDSWDMPQPRFVMNKRKKHFGANNDIVITPGLDGIMSFIQVIHSILQAKYKYYLTRLNIALKSFKSVK